MKHNVFTAIVTALFSLSLSSQTGFQKIFGGTGNDAGYSVLQTADSGYVFSGCWSYYNSVGINGAFLIKADKNGNGLWTKIYRNDPNNNYNGGFALIKTNDNNYAITGQSAKIGVFTPIFYLVKTNQNGDTLWTRVHNGNIADVSSAYSVCHALDNGYIMAGYSTPAAQPDMFVVKTNATGDFVWSKNYFPGRRGVAHSVIESNGNYLIAGYVAEINNVTNGDIFLINITINGDTLWQKTLPGTNDDKGYCLRKTPDNGFILSGTTMSFGTGGYDAYLVKLNSNGIIQWSKTFGGLDDEYANNVSLTSDGGYIIAGSTNSSGAGGFDAYIIKTDSLGNQQWSNTYGGSTDDYAYSIQQTFDGGYIFTGIRNNNVYLVKIDPNGIVTNSNEIDPIAFENGIHIFPNPVTSETTVNLAKHVTDASLTITNTLGQHVRIIKNISGNSIKLNREDLPSGIYYISVAENNIILATEKLIITN